MRRDIWIVKAPPEVHAEAQRSEQDAALESERLESLISVLRRGAARRDSSADRRPGGSVLPRLLAPSDLRGDGMASG